MFIACVTMNECNTWHGNDLHTTVIHEEYFGNKEIVLYVCMHVCKVDGSYLTDVS